MDGAVPLIPPPPLMLNVNIWRNETKKQANTESRRLVFLLVVLLFFLRDTHGDTQGHTLTTPIYPYIFQICKKGKAPEPLKFQGFVCGDPTGTRTRVTAVKGQCLNHLTIGPHYKVAYTDMRRRCRNVGNS